MLCTIVYIQFLLKQPPDFTSRQVRGHIRHILETDNLIFARRQIDLGRSGNGSEVHRSR
jgi:hypothetical protein